MRSRQTLTNLYMWLVIAIGATVFLVSASRISPLRLDYYFGLLILATIIMGSRVAIRIPRINTNITVDDTFIFIGLLLYGSEAAIILGALGGLCSGLRISRRPRTVLFAGAALASALSITSYVLVLVFQSPLNIIKAGATQIIIAMCLMGLVQYLAHTALVATANALKDNQSIWRMWSHNFLWISVTYFAGSATAGIVVGSIGTVRLYALLLAVPIIWIVYLSYDRYMREVKASAKQAEEAERERAEIDRQRAEQAEQHVNELSNYIAEQERIGRMLEETKEHFRHAAFHDSLTGLPNRSLFTELLKAEIETASRKSDYLFAVLFLDLDRFKYINDSLGHVYGDLLLVAFAQRLEKCLRPSDTLSRFGGDEFAVLLSGIQDAENALEVASRIQETLSLPFELEETSSFTTVSIGIALGNSNCERPDDILRDADTAMYRAKENGKARCELFDNEMHAKAVSRLRLERDLRNAVEQKEFRLHYQPIVALDTGRVAGFEALMRWAHPEEGTISPADFIPVAEETGLIVQMGQWVLEEACTTVKNWQQQSPLHQTLSLSVNLSAKQVSHPNLVDEVKQALAKSKLSPECLKLEITESVVMENAEAAAVVFKQLRALGVQLSIDDFGTGYSSLSYLHRFPVNYLKIDRSFVSRMTEMPDNAEIVKTIITLARNLGMQVIAEGVETAAQNTQLTALGCDYGQGYLFSPPVDPTAIPKLLTKEIKADEEILTANASQEHVLVVTSYAM